MTIKIFDTKSTIISKNKASKDWKKFNFIFENSGEILIEKINEIGGYFEKILLITSDSDEIESKIKNINHKNLTIFSQYKELNRTNDKNIKRIFGKFESLHINETFDLVICNLCLHRINDVINFCSKLKKITKKDGALICSYFGGKTLIELRDALIKTDQLIKNKVFQRVIPFIDMIDAGNIFSKVGFLEIVSDKINLTVKYSEVIAILNDIKGMGESNCLVSRNKGLMTQNYIKNLEESYKSKNIDSNGELSATCEIIVLTMWSN